MFYLKSNYNKDLYLDISEDSVTVFRNKSDHILSTINIINCIKNPNKVFDTNILIEKYDIKSFFIFLFKNYNKINTTESEILVSDTGIYFKKSEYILIEKNDEKVIIKFLVKNRIEKYSEEITMSLKNSLVIDNDNEFLLIHKLDNYSIYQL